MISNNTRQTYSEIVSFIQLLDVEKQNKIPQKLRDFFVKEQDPHYTKILSLDIPLEEQYLKKDTLALIAYLSLKYWCEDEEEKKALIQKYQENEETYHKSIQEKLDHLGAEVVANSTSKIETSNTNSSALPSIESPKESFLKRIFYKLKKMFKK